MLKRIVILVVLLTLLIPFASAQTDSVEAAHICGDLADADCQILLDNATMMDALNSFAFTVTMALDVDGDAIEEHMQLAGQGGGALSLDDDALQAVAETGNQITADEAGALLELLITSLTGDVWLDLSGTSADEDFTMELSLRLKEGVVLLNAGAMEELSGQPMTGMEWLGVDVTGAIGDLLTESGMMPDMDANDLEEVEASDTSVTRLPDSEINGVAVAVFETSVDVNSILSLISIEDMIAASDSNEDPEKTMEMVQAIDVRDLSSRQYIGLDDRYTYRLVVSVDLTAPAESGDQDGGEKTIVMDLDVGFSGFNDPVEVEIPEDAMVFPLAMMLQMNR